MEEITAESIRDCFNGSLMALFFPDLQSETGQEYLLVLSNYTLKCGTGAQIAAMCPDMMCCFAQNYIGYLLSSWAAVGAISDDGEICLTDPAVCEPAMYLKTREIGSVTCTWDQIDVRKSCCDCPEQAAAAWKAEYERMIDCCNAANAAVFITAGSWMPDCPQMKGCCGADWSISDAGCCPTEKRC